MTVSLRSIGRDNWRTCISLKPSDDQARFIAPNVVSLAQAKACPECVPLAIYAGERMVGFLMYEPDYDAEGWYSLHRFMMAAEHQRQGYGRAAMRELVKRLREEGTFKQVLLSYIPENRSAEAFWPRMGFQPTGEVQGREIVMRLDL